MNDPDKQMPHSPLTLSMLISEVVYRLVVVIERLIRWSMRNVVRPYLFLFRCLLWG